MSKHHEKFIAKTLKTDLLLLGKVGLVAIVPRWLYRSYSPILEQRLVFIAITAAVVIVSGITWRILLPLFRQRLRHWEALYYGWRSMHRISWKTNSGLNRITLNEFILG